LARQVAETWCKSNGDFHTKGRGDIGVKFLQYSNSKEAYLQPDIVEYDEDKLDKPVFDLNRRSVYEETWYCLGF
jgi:hypothetical protein